MAEYHAYDPSGHIKAVSLLLKNALDFTADKSEKLTKTDYSLYGEFGDMVYGEDFYTSVYCDAAYSHLVASSLSTFFESFFVHEFNNIQDNYDLSCPMNNSSRWRIQTIKNFWNIKKYVTEDGKQKNDVFKGIKQLFEALEIPIPIYPEKWQLLQALFIYRNYIVHNGFEWRRQKINEFLSKTQELNIPNLFISAKSGEDIWIIYLSRDFENSLLELAREFVQLFDLWFNEKMKKHFG